MGIKDLRKTLEKKFSEGIIKHIDEKAKARESYSTGVLSFDYCTVIGGLPKGYYVELYGKESVGKTSLAATAVAKVQRESKTKFCLWLDYENSLDQLYFEKLGVDFSEDKFLCVNPGTVEEGFKIILKVLNDPDIDVGLIVVDSIAIAPSETDVEKLEAEGKGKDGKPVKGAKLGKRRMGATASVMAQILKQINPAFTRRRDCTLLLINQLRNMIGGYMAYQETTGGLALKYAYHMRLQIKKTGFVKIGGLPAGLRTKLKCVKSKVGAPQREVETDLIFGVGFDLAADAFGIGLATGVISKVEPKSPMYQLTEKHDTYNWSPVRGINGFRELYDSDPVFMAVVRERVLAQGSAVSVANSVSVAAADAERGAVSDGVSDDEDAEGVVDGTTFGNKVDLSAPKVEPQPKPASKKKKKEKK